MERRELARTLILGAGAAAGVSLATRRAEAQPCATPCYLQTSAERNASVTPADYSYPPGDLRRYGAVGDGVTDDNMLLLHRSPQLSKT